MASVYPFETKLVYTVSLVNAETEVSPYACLESTPFKSFDNEHQAGHFALGICLQNLSEKEYRAGTDINEEISIDYNFCGTTYTATRAQCIKGRKILSTKFAEYFI